MKKTTLVTALVFAFLARGDFALAMETKKACENWSLARLISFHAPELRKGPLSWLFRDYAKKTLVDQNDFVGEREILYALERGESPKLREIKVAQ